MSLRSVRESDLPVFYEHQRDEGAAKMAGFSPREREPFLKHWHTNVLKPENTTRAIEVDGQLVGYIGSWSQDGQRLVAYWVDRAQWGKGAATRALIDFLQVEATRPLEAFVVEHNLGSRRVLEKAGFVQRPEATVTHPDGVTELLYRLG